MTAVTATMQDNCHDPRVIANEIVCLMKGRGKPVTHIALQKLLYFAHGVFLIRHRKPLVSGFFEAWNYGPVHPGVYAAFKANEARPITTFARRKNLRTGELQDLPPLKDHDARQAIAYVVDSYGKLTAAQLVNLSHARDGPWDRACKNAKTNGAIGLRISNELIEQHFQRHKVNSCTFERDGEYGEDSPITYYGLG